MPPLPSGSDFDLSQDQWSDLELDLRNLLEVVRQLPGAEYDGHFQANTPLTVASGSITPEFGYHVLIPEGGSGADQIDTIDATNLEPGRLLILQMQNSADDIELVHDVSGDGHINLLGEANFSFHDRWSMIVFQYREVGAGSARFTELLRFPGRAAQSKLDFRNLIDVSAAHGHQVFKSTGTTQWTVPDGVTEVEVRVVSGGGGGGGGADASNNGSDGSDGGVSELRDPATTALITAAGGQGGAGGLSNGNYNRLSGGRINTIPDGGGNAPGPRGEYSGLQFHGSGGRGGDGTGGGSSGAPGNASANTGSVSVTPGDTLDVIVGSAGNGGLGGGTGEDGENGDNGIVILRW